MPSTRERGSDGRVERRHRMPFGAELLESDGVRFRLYGPATAHVGLVLEGEAEPLAMRAVGDGWHELTVLKATAGTRYRFRLADGTTVPDPASRFQPEDVAGPSEVIDPAAYAWTDADWRGRPWHETVLYELHIGAFTPEGTFAAATARLDHLADVGVTAIELMAVADFAGLRGWGYDGVLLYAPDSAYGRPEELKAFVDAAHGRGIAVIFDVVYNHFGPEGNYLPRYFPQVMTDANCTPWGSALNFDGDGSEPVRGFILHNALYWVEEFHADGLRLDASHAMIDNGPRHILDELASEVRALAGSRAVHLILEDEHNITQRLVRDEMGRPQCYTAQWNHDITHLLGAAMAQPRAPGQTDDGGETEKLGKALAEGFVIAAQMQEPLPASSPPVPPVAFVAFLQTHDLVGNRIFGERIYATAAVEAVRAAAAVFLLMPQVPMLFMGDEWGASTPFPFFSDFHGELAEAVRKGRCEQLGRLEPRPDAADLERAPNPQAVETFASAKLHWEEIAEAEHAAWLGWYRRVLRRRLERVAPLLKDLRECCGRSRVVAPGALTVEWTLGDRRVLRLAANLHHEPVAGFPEASGDGVWLEGVDEGSGRLGAWAVRWTLE